MMYEGRSINKLQNDVILSIFKIWKFLDVRSIGNLIPSMRCEFHFDDVTVMSFINIRYCNLLLKASRKEQRCVICKLQNEAW